MEQYLYNPDLSHSNHNFVMAYPAIESFALSSLGYMKLFQTADTLSYVNAQRISTDKPIPKFKQTHSMAFSLSFDFDFVGVFEILDRNNVKFLSKERDDKSPVIFAGGPVITTNPAPYKKIFDFMLIGDGEDNFSDILEVLSKDISKKEKLNRLSNIDGVYVPGINNYVKKISATLENVIYTPILSDNSYFKNTFIVELQRGCMNRCGFCTASYLNAPFRSYPYEKIIEAIELGLQHTNKIALLGAQISAHPDFDRIMDYLKNKMIKGKNIELGISSLRADSVTADMVRTLVLGGQKTSTIAIEAASEKLRKFINKNLSNEQICKAVKICRENGLKGLKIYSMIGIPNETEFDIQEFIRLAKILKNENKCFNLTFSFSSFVPKPQTPFQWTKREDTKSLEKKQKFLEHEFAKLGIESKFSSIKTDYWQTVLSRGDEDYATFLIETYKYGGKSSSFKKALKTTGINIEKSINGYTIDEILPWDFIQNPLKKEYLKSEYGRLYKFIK